MQAANRIITAAEMTEIDRRTQSVIGIPGMLLMENAGQKAWAVVRECVGTVGERHRPPRIAFIAGNGNNGGDALVMARQSLIEGEHECVVITVARELTGSTQEQWSILHQLGMQRHVWNDEPQDVSDVLADADWIVDGIAGTGISGPLRDPIGSLVGVINRSTARVVAVDVPSGLRDGFRRGDSAIRADLTVVTGYLKAMLFESHTRALVGEIHRVDPGFPPGLVNDPQVVTTRIAEMPPSPHHPAPLHSDFHKGQRGRVLVVGGSPGTAGAAVLSAEGAAAAGAGMIRVLASGQGVATVLARIPSVMAAEIPAVPNGDELREALAWADAVVLGPGWTTLTDSDLVEWLRYCSTAGTALVLDASALRVIAQRGDAWKELFQTALPTVLTPHLGEWQALVADDDVGGVRETLEQFPDRSGLSIIVKSAVTWVRHSTGEVDVLDGRAPALAVAGSGDVLSGIVVAALARGMAAGLDTPEMVRDALRWGLTRHLSAGRALTQEDRAASAADIAARVAAGFGPSYG
ncbi:MAG TPA: NAD(P)H-hydrate dehydratase [Alkalispirochaeta sp.]|nr:NAD(P)H-hydrate dehydratase [Alkalispirochaeta sp.]